MESQQQVFTGLLQQAVHEPGVISRAYHQFHSYSLGNQLQAWLQCRARGIPSGPIATLPGWRALGRRVRKGERALSLCVPVFLAGPPAHEGTDAERRKGRMLFVFKPRWFVLSQTDGPPVPDPEIPAWDRARALKTLKIREVPFELEDGNCLGYAEDRTIALNPLDPLPHGTRFHELAHVLLGHTSKGPQVDLEHAPRSLRECEAEAVALLCCDALELPGAVEARGYIQHWWGSGHPIPERSVQRIFKAADKILKAGTATPPRRQRETRDVTPVHAA